MVDKIYGPSHSEGQQLLKESEYGSLEEQIWALKRKQNKLQDTCLHPESHLQQYDDVEYHGASYGPKTFWTNYHCYMCNTAWSVERPDPMSAFYRKILGLPPAPDGDSNES